MKHIFLAVLIAFVPVMITGCNSKEPEAEAEQGLTLEQKYGSSRVAQFQVQIAINDWEGHLAYIEKAREERKNTRRKKLLEKVRFMEEELTIDDYDYAQACIKGIVGMYQRVLGALSKKMSIEDARKTVRSQYLLPPSPRAVDGIEEAIDRMIVAVYLCRASQAELTESALVGKHFLLPVQKEKFSAMGL